MTKVTTECQWPSLRSESKEQGLKYFFTGKPCVNGHVSVRHTSTGGCYECKLAWRKTPNGRASDQKYRKKHRAQLNKQTREYKERVGFYEKNKEAIKDKARKWNKQNPERKREQSAAWRKQNPEKAYQMSLTWIRNNPHKSAQYRTLRRTKIQQALVAWANIDAIRDLYEQARNLTHTTGIPHEVDHIVPLNNDLVCGLHWEGNLQILTKPENARKHNKLLDC